MKKINYLFFAVISILSAKDFTVSDPPMLYIYHFVSYDTTSILLHGGDQDESKSKILQFPLFNKNDISSGENLVLRKTFRSQISFSNGNLSCSEKPTC